MLMRPDNGGVDHGVFVIRIFGQVLKRLSQTPPAAQREKRLWMFLQSPKRSGKSAPRGPERNFQITASTNRRLPSSLLRPTVPGAPVEEVFNPRKLVVAQSIALHRKSLLKEGSL